jgi:DNA-directed RNA polymerase subunit RPC12/RpoP
MKLLDFDKHFPSEAVCIEKFKELRIKSGIVCPHCGNKEHIWLPASMNFECKSCHSRRSLRSGTIMHGSKLPFYISLKPFICSQAPKRPFQPLRCNDN